MRRRILMIVHGPYPVGEPRVAREAAAALAAGFAVDVLCMRGSGEPARERVEGVDVVRLPLAHRRGGVAVLAEYAAFTLLAVLRAGSLHARRRYAIVQVHNPPDFLVLASLVPRLLGARAILDVHDLAPEMFAMRFGNSRFSSPADHVLRGIERVATRFVDAAITVHEPYARELVTRGVARERVTVVMNSLDEALLPQGRPVTMGRDAGAPRIVYHGTVTPPYGVGTLVESYAAVRRTHPDAALAIYGAGDALAPALERARMLGVAASIDAPGRYLPHADVLRAVEGAAVGVIPNLETPISRYALSTKLFEYVALGIPVVCSDLPTLREHFTDAEMVFVPPGDAAALAAAIGATLDDPRASAARAEAAQARYLREYRWAVSAARYTRLLDRIAGSAR